MTIEELIGAISALPGNTLIYIETFNGPMPITAVRLVEVLAPRPDQASDGAIHLSASAVPAGYAAIETKLVDALDRIAPKREPWDEP